MSDAFGRYAKEKDADETPMAVEIKDRNGEPYVGTNGQPITITVLGKYSKQARELDRKMTNRTLKEVRRGLDFTADEAEARGIERLAGVCTAWTVEDEKGDVVPFSVENVATFLRVAPWVGPQLEQAIEAPSRFFTKRSANS